MCAELQKNIFFLKIGGFKREFKLYFYSQGLSNFHQYLSENTKLCLPFEECQFSSLQCGPIAC